MTHDLCTTTDYEEPCLAVRLGEGRCYRIGENNMKEARGKG